MHNEFDKLVHKLIEKIVSEQSLDIANIIYKENKTNNDPNKKMPKSLSLVEMVYPPDPPKGDRIAATKSILRVGYKKEKIIIVISKNQFNNTYRDTIYNFDVKKKTVDYVEIEVNEISDDLFTFIESNILYCLMHYTSANTFSCCSQFTACSNMKKCVHQNNLYAKGCYYRRNLEMGKIFYGKNKII